MKLQIIDNWLKKYLNIPNISDYSQNGLQIGNINAKINKITFAVDACMETFIHAEENKSELIFVHHGLLWNKPIYITGNTYERISFLIKNNLNLYAAHLPLDLHAEIGNNICIAKKLKLKKIEPFGIHNGIKIGYKGILPKKMKIDEIIKLLKFDKNNIKTLNFSGKSIESIAIISGGAAKDITQAIDENIDLYITGEASHSIYHLCKESSINAIFGGHYDTETFGIKALAKKVQKELKIETFFINIPTLL